MNSSTNVPYWDVASRVGRVLSQVIAASGDLPFLELSFTLNIIVTNGTAKHSLQFLCADFNMFLTQHWLEIPKVQTALVCFDELVYSRERISPVRVAAGYLKSLSKT